MKLFERTGGHWIFYISVAYFVVGMFSIYNGADLTWAGPLYIFFLSMPFWFPPLGRSMNLDVTWDQKMLDWFKKKQSNVVPFPTEKQVEQPPPPPEPEKPTTVYYRIGMASDNRVSIQVGYGEITMNAQGVQNMIDQLELFKNQIQHNESKE